MKAKEHCRKLIGVKPQYRVELARIQKELGEVEEKKQEGIPRKPGGL